MPKKFTLGLTCILVLIIWFTTPAERQFQEFITKYYTSGYTDFRMGYDAILNITDTVHWENDIVYFVSEDEIDIYISNFNTFPLTLSFNFPYWKNELSYNEYLEFLSSKPNVNLYPIYTEEEQRYVTNKQKGEMYVYVLKATDDFRLRHQIFFEEEILEETLYKINISEEKINFQQVL